MKIKLNLIILIIFNHYYMEAYKNLTSWIEYNSSTEIFPIQNIPFGVCHLKSESKTVCCSRIANNVIDLSVLEQNNLLNSEYFSFNPNNQIFNKNELNSFIELGRNVWKAIRASLQVIFSNPKFANDEKVKNSLLNINDVLMTIPVKVGDYTDFYSSKNHAFNMGVIIRGPEQALQPNWVHLPVGYHGQ